MSVKGDKMQSILVKETKDFLKRVKKSKLKCMKVEVSTVSDKSVDYSFAVFPLRIGYTEDILKKYLKSLNSIDIETADYVTGTMWFEDGSYAHCEPVIDEEPQLYGYMWRHYKIPEIPDICKEEE